MYHACIRLDVSQQVSQGPARASTSLNVWGDKDYLIAPSILSADFAKLGEEVDNVLEAGADVVHFDVMDNHYVPNLTIGPMVCKALRDHGVTAPIDVHLMVRPVDAAISDFIDAGASYITFHPETTNHVDRTLQLIKNGGCKAGLVINPATSLDYCKVHTCTPARAHTQGRQTDNTHTNTHADTGKAAIASALARGLAFLVHY